MDYQLMNDAADFLRRRWSKAAPVTGSILGSGWSQVVEELNIVDRISYDEIPGLGSPSIAGHAGTLSLAEISGKQVIIFQGRRHWYEGVGWTPIAIPVFLLKAMGVQFVLITNAAGGINSELHPGNLMIMNDHINLMGLNPLVGPHNEVWGPRYPDMSYLYDRELRSALASALQNAGERPYEGVYCAVQGPSFETPSEIRMMKVLGADAVGMSTVPEAILARGAGMRVSALSCITNYAAGIGKEPLTHAEVLETTKTILPRMRSILGEYYERLCAL